MIQQTLLQLTAETSVSDWMGVVPLTLLIAVISVMVCYITFATIPAIKVATDSYGTCAERTTGLLRALATILGTIPLVIITLVIMHIFYPTFGVNIYTIARIFGGIL